ncbi:MAG: ABC transporter permease [Anaerolineae bacterium]|nr:ABC transporter permease [Anaerolineae bacterium]
MHYRPRLSKVIADLWQQKARTLLIIIAITIGVSAFGGMFITRQVLIENMNTAHAATNPATVSLYLNSFNESLLRTVRSIPQVYEVTAYKDFSAQVWNGESWLMGNLSYTEDLSNAAVDRVGLEAGTFDMGRGEIVLERQSIALLDDVGLGDTVLIEIEEGEAHEYTVVGICHNTGSLAANSTRMVTGFISKESLASLGITPLYRTLALTTDPSLTTRPEIEEVAEEIVKRLEGQGYVVNGYGVDLQEEHWAAKFINIIVLALAGLGLLSLGLSGLLVVNTINSLMTQQKRQVGMMKAVGANGRDVIGIYMLLVGSYGVLALIFAIPGGILLAKGATNLLAYFFNVDIVHFWVPPWVFLLQVFTAIIAPLIAALIPVMKGTRVTVYETVSDYGIKGTGGKRKRERSGKRSRLPRPVLLSLRNTFRQKKRLLLTLAALSVAGVTFLGVINGYASGMEVLDEFRGMFDFDIEIALSQPQHIQRLQREASRVEGVDTVEGWAAIGGTILRPDEVLDQYGGSKEGSSISILGTPYDSAFLTPSLIEGRWLQPGDGLVAVVTSEVWRYEPYLEVGDEIHIDLGDRNCKMTIIGFVDLIGTKQIYAPYDTVARLDGTPGQSMMALIRTESRSAKDQEIVGRAVEERYRQAGIPVDQAVTINSLFGMIVGMINFFLYFVLLMAALLGVVGGLGLATTMSLNVLERTREIGVMRAIGSADRSLRGIFLAEGMVTGLLSYIIAAVVSIPVNIIGIHFAGPLILNRAIDPVFTPLGYLIWLAAVVAISTVASLLPARWAARVSVREALAYE